MNGHLTDEQFAAAVAGLELENTVRQHLGSCIGCRSSVAEMGRLIDARRAQMEAEEPDWQAQRERVAGSLDPRTTVPRRPRWRAPALAAAAMILIAVGLGLVQFPGSTNTPVDEIAVEDILAEAETLLADDSIPGFEIIDPGFAEIEDYLPGEAENGGTS